MVVNAESKMGKAVLPFTQPTVGKVQVVVSPGTIVTTVVLVEKLFRFSLIDYAGANTLTLQAQDTKFDEDEPTVFNISSG